MALELTKEQEAALIIVADRELARKATEDAVAQAEAALADVEQRFMADQNAARDAVITAYTAELRAKQEALQAAKDAIQDNIKAVAISDGVAP